MTYISSGTSFAKLAKAQRGEEITQEEDANGQWPEEHAAPNGLQSMASPKVFYRHGQLEVRMNQLQAGARISVFSIDGRQLYSGVIPQGTNKMFVKQMNISTSGKYVVQIRTDQQSYTVPLAILR